jgi:thiamine-monophosphate kinase
VLDGLAADAGHVAKASDVALVIEAASIPLSAVASHYVSNGKASLADLVTGGDDYQTLFAAPVSAREAIAASKFGVTRIGRVEAGSGVRVIDASGAEMALPKSGWTHFGSGA